ncbi:urease accessory protein UreF [soil metagenome]
MTNLALLRLLQLTDSQFPIGSFAHSSGLETYAQMGMDKEGLAEVLAAGLEHGFGWLDLAACALAFQAETDAALQELCHEVTAWKPVPGLRETSLKLGKRMLTLMSRLYPEVVVRLEEPHHPVVFGVLGRRLGIDSEPLLLALAQSTLTSSLAAATRCMSLSPEQAQEMLTNLQPQVIVAVERVLADPQANFFSATPALDVRAHQQAFLYSRLFQS